MAAVTGGAGSAAAADLSDVIEAAILAAVKDGGVIEDSEPFAAANGWEPQAVVGVMKSLESEKYVSSTPITKEFLVLSEEALSYIQHGSPEVQMFNRMPAEIDDAGLDAMFGKEFVAIAKGKAMKNKWITRGKGADGKYTKAVAAVERDELVEHLKAAREGTLKDAKVLKDLASRTLVAPGRRTAFRITAGPSWAPVRVKLAADITKEMLESGSWATTPFKAYNYESAGKDVAGGHLHALMRVRAEFRSILLEMG